MGKNVNSKHRSTAFILLLNIHVTGANTSTGHALENEAGAVPTL